MSGWRDLWRRILPLRRVEPDVDDELRFHIEGKVEELMEQGLGEEEARREAHRRFGDYERVEAATRRYAEDRARDQVRRARLDILLHDARLALRTLIRSPGFTAAVVATLALGIGATTAIFSVVNGVLLTPLPYPDSDRLVVVWQNDRATGTVREPAATADYWDFRERSRSFAGLAMHATYSVTLAREGGEPRRLRAAAVSHTLDEVLGVSPRIGRAFTAEDDRPGAGRVALLTDRLWRAEFGADPSVLGRTVTVDEEPVAVIGVLPPDLEYPGPEVDLWVPIRETPATAARNPHFVRVLGRLAPGVSIDAVQREMTRIAAELEAEYPANANRGAFVESLDDVKRGDVRRTLWVLFGAVLTVLAIACANVANLLLARGAARARETAVCAALGAGTGRLARRFALEGVMVAGAAVTVGIGLAWVGVQGLLGLAPAELVALGDVSLDGRVLLFASAVGAAVAVGFGLLPTLQARKLDLQSHLKEGRRRDAGAGPGRLGLRRLLVAGQVALATVLLTSAGLLGATLRNLSSVDPGFRTENVVRVSYTLPASRYPRDFSRWPNWTELHSFHRDLLREAGAVPGVTSVAVVANHPLERGFTNSFSVVGAPPDPSQGEIPVRMVSPGYFETTGVRIVEGRGFRMSDETDAPWVMVVNRETVRRLFPDTDPLGQRITMWGGREFRIVGVAENERFHGLEEEAPPAFYMSMLQAPSTASRVRLMARTRGEPLDVVPGLREAIRSVDPNLAVFDASTMDATLREATARERFAAVIVAVFAGVAIGLAVLGIYAVLSYLVARRTHEVGVRMALGASRGSVVWRVLRQGLGMAALGITAGVLGAVGVSRLLESLLFGVSGTDPVAYGVVAAVLLGTAAVAAFVPARRAAYVDPAGALRGE